MAWHFGASGGWAKRNYDCAACKRDPARRRYNCRRYFRSDYDSLSEARWWSAIYYTDQDNKKEYRPDEFRWHECPISALSAPRDGWDPVEVVTLLGEARMLGRGALYQLCKKDARLWDAAVVIEHCRNAERVARFKAEHPPKR